jgi:hypothetical protein
MKIELELGNPHGDLDALRRHGFDSIAEQIEAQLPKPVPPEPTGDVVVRTPGGWFFVPMHGWWRRDDQPGGGWSWADLTREHKEYQVYRPEPSPERVEELVATQAARIHANALEYGWDLRDYEIVLGDFAAALLGGAS